MGVSVRVAPILQVVRRNGISAPACAAHWPERQHGLMAESISLSRV
jgi:hypothetical protein